MAHATTTIREVKNKDTGIDLAVNTYKETKAMIGATYEYQVMVVSNLSFFKTAKHKESDNVQFTVLKKFNEFEELYTKLNAKFSGTVFPPLPKKVLMMSEAVAKERRAGLDHIVKYIAMTPKISTSPVLLEFLGVSSIKAGKFRKMEVSDSVVDRQEAPEDEKDKAAATEGQADKKDVEEEDLFENGTQEQTDNLDDEDLFGDENMETVAIDSTKIFEDQDLSGAFDEGDAEDLFLPDAKVEQTQKVTRQESDEENDDLFKVNSEDDLDKIMQLSLKPKTENDTANSFKDIETEVEATKTTEPTPESDEDVETEVKEAKPTEIVEEVEATKTEQNDSTESNVKTEVVKEQEADFEGIPVITPDKPDIKPKPRPTARPTPAARPKPGTKPKPAAKPKPVIAAKPSIGDVDTNKNSPLVETNSKSSQSESVLQRPVPSPRPKPPLKQKPQLATKPQVKPKPSDVKASADTAEASESLGGLPSENISEDDIMKYIQANTSADDVDLFS